MFNFVVMMRKIISILLTVTACFCAFAGDNNSGKLKFEHTAYDFGFIPESGGKVSHEFTFENIGDAPLVITSANAQCGCTVPEYPKGEIAPGEKGVLKVTYSPKGNTGSFLKTVTVRSTGKPSKITLKINMFWLTFDS